MLFPKQTLKITLQVYNRNFNTQYLYIEQFDQLFDSTRNHEALICSLEDLRCINLADDYLVLDFGDDCNVYLFTDGFEFEGDSPRSSLKMAI